MSKFENHHFSLPLKAQALDESWKSNVLVKLGNTNFKVLRMDATAYPDEVHDFDEGLLVIEGQMNLIIQHKLVTVQAGEIFIVPKHIPHQVAPGSFGTLVILDQ